MTKKGMKEQLAGVERRKAMYRPGNVVWDYYWRQYDLVLSYNDIGAGHWNTTVVQCDIDGNRLKTALPRTHSTPPDTKDKLVMTGVNTGHSTVWFNVA